MPFNNTVQYSLPVSTLLRLSVVLFHFSGFVISGTPFLVAVIFLHDAFLGILCSSLILDLIFSVASR